MSREIGPLKRRSVSPPADCLDNYLDLNRCGSESNGCFAGESFVGSFPIKSGSREQGTDSDRICNSRMDNFEIVRSRVTEELHQVAWDRAISLLVKKFRIPR